ncbi:MAG: type II secretion system minor pseudopilin GspJ [Candidatus Thiodiazotropha sp.]
MMHRSGPPRQAAGIRGFTLLELLIAITIFAVIASFVYAGLKVVLDTKKQTDEYLDRLTHLQLGLNLMQRDIEQTVDRPVRDEFGDPQAALRSGGQSTLLLELTRGGYANPMKLPRSSLQRVGYQLEDETLYRVTWPALDRAQNTEPHRQRLFGGIKGIEIVYYDQAMAKKTEWPAQKTGAQQTVTALPKAIEVDLELDKWGNVRRLFPVAQTLQQPAG